MQAMATVELWLSHRCPWTELSPHRMITKKGSRLKAPYALPTVVLILKVPQGELNSTAIKETKTTPLRANFKHYI